MKFPAFIRVPIPIIAARNNHLSRSIQLSPAVARNSHISRSNYFLGGGIQISQAVRLMSESTEVIVDEIKPFLSTVLFIECVGYQSLKVFTCALCRNRSRSLLKDLEMIRMANPQPRLRHEHVGSGYDNMKLSVILAVPKKYQHDLDLDQCAKVFPYGNIQFTVQDGGMVAPSGVAIEKLGDSSDDMVIVCCSVMVGY